MDKSNFIGPFMLREASLLEFLTQIVSIAASLAVIVTAIFVFYQVRLQAKQKELASVKDSFDAIQAVFMSEAQNDLRNKFIALISKRNGMSFEISDDEDVRAERKIYYKVCNDYELIASQMQLGLIHEELVKEYWKNTWVNEWHLLSGFVESVREHSGNNAYYVKFEHYAKIWDTPSV